jgi:hypothetical protein
MFWIWIIVGIIITFWGVILIWRYVQAGNNSSANSGSSYVNITDIKANSVSIEWGNGPVTNGHFFIYTRNAFNIFRSWDLNKTKPGNGYTGGTDTIIISTYGWRQVKVTGDNYTFGIAQRNS